ncbi:hypothetical protein [Silvanigrella aquatica]|uniref:Cytochrome c family protein n=1 Tax=Silvanigrella aquatica TaxID=1915309 RepID=A0A1L4CWZ7_9BACT|nr:hypothetical protein [Silvanigrella aquatica]APJ02472.1 hypothetical protein AXG55_00390 [Silvanigrella aquatica]
MKKYYLIIFLFLEIISIKFYENKNFLISQAQADEPVPGHCTLPPKLSPNIPVDMSAPNSQVNANCLAWQEFISLNWVANAETCEADDNQTPQNFGVALNSSPVVWETYKETSEIFLKKAQKPAAWCSKQNLPPQWKSKLKSTLPNSKHGYKILASISKNKNNSDILNLESYEQAGANSWITSQAKKLALYEIRVNEDEFNYINKNELYNANTQQKIVTTQGINLPDGSATFSQYGKIGSIELKASWVELPDSKTWPYFKISKAVVRYPNNKTPQTVTVGLTGLHIIHKTKRSPQFIWATFEHVNNSPDIKNNKNNLLPWYTFYNLNCNPNSDHYHCYPNAQPPSATPQKPYFPTYPQDPYEAPIQVMRMTPISNTTVNPVADLNKWVWNQVIAPANKNSVFLNYQLVNVVWANSPQIIQPGAPVPLTDGNQQPSDTIVANTTMETYFQETKSCLFCHQYASIADVSSTKSKSKNHFILETQNILKLLQLKNYKGEEKVKGNNAKYASDYSFIFSSAQSP